MFGCCTSTKAMLGRESNILLVVSNYFQAQNDFEVLPIKTILGGLFVITTTYYIVNIGPVNQKSTYGRTLSPLFCTLHDSKTFEKNDFKVSTTIYTTETKQETSLK